MCNHKELIYIEKETTMWSEDQGVLYYECKECGVGLWVATCIDLYHFELDAQNHGCEVIVNKLLKIIENKEKCGSYSNKQLELLANKILGLINK